MCCLQCELRLRVDSSSPNTSRKPAGWAPAGRPNHVTSTTLFSFSLTKVANITLDLGKRFGWGVCHKSSSFLRQCRAYHDALQHRRGVFLKPIESVCSCGGERKNASGAVGLAPMQKKYMNMYTLLWLYGGFTAYSTCYNLETESRKCILYTKCKGHRSAV